MKTLLKVITIVSLMLIQDSLPASARNIAIYGVGVEACSTALEHLNTKEGWEPTGEGQWILGFTTGVLDSLQVEESIIGAKDVTAIGLLVVRQCMVDPTRLLVNSTEVVLDNLLIQYNIPSALGSKKF